MTEGIERDDWSLAELLDAHADAQRNEISTAFPARVESYDAGQQVADVQPMVRRALFTEDGEVVYEDRPVLRCVRVLWPRAGGWTLTMPLAAGDLVLVICCDRDIQRFLQTGQVSPPPDLRLHHVANAVCLPVGPYPRSRALANVATDALELGHDESAVKIRVTAGGEVHVVGDMVRLGSATADDGVSLSSKVDFVINAFLDATPTANDGGAALQAAMQLAWDTLGVAPTTGSAKVLAE